MVGSSEHQATAPAHIGAMVMVIPTYNEAQNLEWIVGRLRAAVPTSDVLIVDDNSPDGTGQIADDLATEDPQIKVLHRTEKNGLGAAYVAGFLHALDLGYDTIGEMDADGSHRPEQISLLMDALASADLVIGSRWIRGGTVTNWSRSREALSRGGNLYTRLLLGMPVRDATAGFRLFRRSTLERIDLRSVQSLGYVFQADMAFRTHTRGMRVVEVPIDFEERARGESKMSADVATESLKRITLWGVGERRRQLVALARTGRAQVRRLVR